MTQDNNTESETKTFVSDEQEAQRDYRETLFLPKTEFPMRAGLPQKEPDWIEAWQNQEIYKKLRQQSKGRPSYILHDGPPYANGHIHMGTALNKVLKDILVRSHQMMGYDAPYRPGWDCHGLPIEWKVEEFYRKKGIKKEEVPVREFRQECRAFATKWLDIQREEFRRLGIFGDWDSPYNTMKHDSEAAIVNEFLKFVQQGLVYRGSKPVMWSPVEQTALAEAEIEYQDHRSTQVWVRFPVRKGALVVAPGKDGSGQKEEEENRSTILSSGKTPSIVIWTTTPWTLPGNRAVAYSDEISYGLYEVKSLVETDFKPWVQKGDRLVVADALWSMMTETCHISEAERLGTVSSEILSETILAHPLAGKGYDFDVPLLKGKHVTEEAGTGFVHIAPGHGPEDYQLWRSYGYEEIPEMIDEQGIYYNHVPLFAGEKILITEGKKAGREGGANRAVLLALVEEGSLLSRAILKHSYPHSWRSKAPVIFRNTPQWFIRMDQEAMVQKEASASNNRRKSLRERALTAIDEVHWLPEKSRNRIRAMVADRPDWLISRQRAWGVPLTLFVHKETREILIDSKVNARIFTAIKEQGADAWFEQENAFFLGKDYPEEDWEKVTDILDVWFDSGSTHAFVLENKEEASWPADLYMEGSDQHRGWFQSSLLESCGTRGKAPYRAVFTHGFVVDETGRKMSKSLGNDVSPITLAKQSGAEILRMWVASSDYADDLRIGKEIIQSQLDAYRKLRNTIRYLLGALSNFQPEETLSIAEMPSLERWVLHRLSELDIEIKKAYKALDIKRVYSILMRFAASDLSAFYFDIRKDSLYCDARNSIRRRACRTVFNHLFHTLTHWLAPIFVFTMEEAWLCQYPEADSLHLQTFPDLPKDWRAPEIAEKWEHIRDLRRVVTGALEVERRQKTLGSSLEAKAWVYTENPVYRKALEGESLADIAIVSQAELKESKAPEPAFTLEGVEDIKVVIEKAKGKKCARSWRILEEVGVDSDYPDLSLRDAEVVRNWDQSTTEKPR